MHKDDEHKLDDIAISIDNRCGCERSGYVIEQGIPVMPMQRDAVSGLRLLDENGDALPCSIEHDGRDAQDRTVWVRLSAPVDVGAGQQRAWTLSHRPSLPPADTERLRYSRRGARLAIESPYFTVSVRDAGRVRIATPAGPVLDGEVSFHLWPDARSIVGAGAGTSRLAFFEPDEWRIEERTDHRCLLLLTGRVRKYAAYTKDPSDFDPQAQFDCELELLVYSFSPVIHYRWRLENQTVWQTYLERYALSLPLAGGARTVTGDDSGDGKFLRWVTLETPGGQVSLTANYVDVLGDGAGISVERTPVFSTVDVEEIVSFADGRAFEPHRFLSQSSEDGCGLNLVSGGINPPHDGCMWAENPEVHRLFYRGMGRTFDGSIVIGGHPEAVKSELSPLHFTLSAQHYSDTGVLPEAGEPVTLGEFAPTVTACAEWMLRRQWRGTLWWGEWWREWDELRKQGVESTANANNALAPLYHYWRTGDSRFVDCAKRAMEFAYDVQLNKQRVGIAPFFHSRRFLIDQMEWVHMRYQRIEGPVKTAHFLGDRRLRTRIIESMRRYAAALVCPDGAPGYAEGGALKGKRVPAGWDCTNFGEVLGICYSETGDPELLRMARKMANWTLRRTDIWDWDADIGNSYHWHFLMRGMLSTIRLTGNRRYIDWYVDIAEKNLTYPVERMEFRFWMDWLLVEAEKLSGRRWFLEEIRRRTLYALQDQMPDGSVRDRCDYPWSKWPSVWQRLYDQKTVVAYVPVLAARLASLECGPDRQAGKTGSAG